MAVGAERPGRLSGRVALVTGGASGIGLATTRRLAGEGARVALVDRDREAGSASAAALCSAGLEVAFYAGDVTDEPRMTDMTARVADQLGPIDILVNNAAVSFPLDFLEGGTDRWRSVFDVIVYGAFHLSRAVAGQMLAGGRGGSIVNISSINGSRGAPRSSHYNAGKGALDQLTRCLAVELAPHRIRVNGIAPGFVDTPMSIVEGENELHTDWFRAFYIDGGRIPMRRPAEADEIASVVAFLVSEDASYVCGATLPVDGGLSVTF